MLDYFFVVLAAALASYLVPGVGAQTVCKKDEKTGVEVCDGRPKIPTGLPVAAKAAIAIVTLTVIFLILLMFFFIRRSRKAAEEADKDVMVEASQMTGPATVLAATYTPETGHSRVYSIGPDSGGFSAVPVPLTPAPVPAAVYSSMPVPSTPQMATSSAGQAGGVVVMPMPDSGRPSFFNRFGATANTGSQPKTAPAQKANFEQPYPFTGFGNTASNSTNSTSQPRSAFVSGGGFPRPLLAGRLKDRIRERPPSVSSIVNVPPANTPTAGMASAKY